jgi:hypothetical protein
VVPYLVIAHSQLLAHLHVGIVYRFVVHLTKDQLTVIVAVFNEEPYPLTDGESLIFDLDLDVIALFVFALNSPKKHVNRSGLLKRDCKRRTINWIAG